MPYLFFYLKRNFKKLWRRKKSKFNFWILPFKSTLSYYLLFIWYRKGTVCFKVLANGRTGFRKIDMLLADFVDNNQIMHLKQKEYIVFKNHKIFWNWHHFLQKYFCVNWIDFFPSCFTICNKTNYSVPY